MCLQKLVQDKSGLKEDGDGNVLMAEAFKLQDRDKTALVTVADLSTETGKSIQRGMQFWAQGVIAAIRNPYSHGHRRWSETECREMLAMISLLHRWVADRSQLPPDPSSPLDALLDQLAQSRNTFSPVIRTQITDTLSKIRHHLSQDPLIADKITNTLADMEDDLYGLALDETIDDGAFHDEAIRVLKAFQMYL